MWGGGTSPQYIKGIARQFIADGSIPLPKFLTVDTVNFGLTTPSGIAFLSTLTLVATEVDCFDEMETLLYLQSKQQESLDLFEDALNNDSLTNKTDETIEQIEDNLENGSGHGGYLCTVKLQQQNNDTVAVLTILAFVAP